MATGFFGGALGAIAIALTLGTWSLVQSGGEGWGLFLVMVVLSVVGAVMGVAGAVGAIVVAQLVRLLTPVLWAEGSALIAGSIAVSVLCTAWVGQWVFGAIIGVLAGIAYVLVVRRERRRTVLSDAKAATPESAPEEATG
ncbi:hypothetical protein [Schumannella luteola]